MSDVQRKVVVVVAVFHIREGLSLPVEAFDLVVNKSSPSVNSTFAGVRRRYRTTYVTNCTIPLRTTLKVYNFFKGVGQFLRLQGGGGGGGDSIYAMIESSLMLFKIYAWGYK